ncbi:MAG TPA: thioredoxin family protein [Candidatus Polarisedimenticolia bacterium]|nr:thioredoxin family protein [Candidatus Polarisedimenticolia bacterium]
MRLRSALLLLPALLILALPAARAGDELAIGAQGPDFNLKATDGKMYTLASVAGSKGTAVIFTCNACPYSQGYEARLIDLAKEYEAKGIGFIAINPNDPQVQPADSFDKMVQRARKRGFPYPYAFDATQATAAAYGARVTPHVFLLDAHGTLVYRGRVDDSLDTKEVKSHDFQNALDALVAGKPVPVAETKAFGCGVKWGPKQQG